MIIVMIMTVKVIGIIIVMIIVMIMIVKVIGIIIVHLHCTL